MKRFVILVLLAVLPLQITWGAGIPHCPHDGDDGVQISSAGDASHSAHVHAHDGDDTNDGHAAGSGLHCSVFHFVALESPAAGVQPLPPAGAAAPEVVNSGYESHIPDGLDRPNWRFAA